MKQKQWSNDSLKHRINESLVIEFMKEWTIELTKQPTSESMNQWVDNQRINKPRNHWINVNQRSNESRKQWIIESVSDLFADAPLLLATPPYLATSALSCLPATPSVAPAAQLSSIKNLPWSERFSFRVHVGNPPRKQNLHARKLRERSASRSRRESRYR